MNEASYAHTGDAWYVTAATFCESLNLRNQDLETWLTRGNCSHRHKEPGPKKTTPISHA